MTKQEKGTLSCFLPHKKCYFLLKQELKRILSYLFICEKKDNQGDTFEEDYAICKALAKHFDREYIEELKAFYGLEDLDF
jgi:hypothetical protein